MEKNYWKWNGYHFDTLQQAKNCIEGDFNGKIANLLGYDGYDKIWHIVNHQPHSFVYISTNKNGYAKFSRIHKVFVEP